MIKLANKKLWWLRKSCVLWKGDKIREASKTVEDCIWYNKQTKFTRLNKLKKKRKKKEACQ